MRFEILGPIRAVLHDRKVQVTAGQDAALLALLLLDANHTVSVDRLVDALWADTAPKHARNQLHVCVSRLRRLLAKAGGPSQAIATDPSGYRLRATTETLDLLQFRTLVADARAAAGAGEHERACARYRAALGLWRGPALAGIERSAIRRAATALDEERAQALEERIEVDLALGASGELIGELTELIQRYPYRERLQAALMIALYRADRQADALAAYQRIRQTLIEELGQEPGPTLRDVHHRILIGDGTLRPVMPIERTAKPVRPAGCLPRTLADFTGRGDDLAWLIQEASQADSFAPLVLVIDGMPGVGKTSLAVRAAHELASNYPDGQLFIDLHGHSEHRPVDPAAALDTMLRQLGVPAAHIPTDLDERIGRWRAELADRRVLVVLDNAATTAQVLPLLPTKPGSLAFVTSRRRLVDLEGATPRSVDLLDAEDAIALLQRVVGKRIRVEPDAAAEVAKRCGYLPLALRLAGARLAHRPHWRVQDLADRLANPGTPLAELAAGDRTVADAFGLSYAQLTLAAQGLFRLLGLHPGETLDVYAAAALADLSLSDARRLLDDLVDSHLVEESDANRYRLHDLVKAYAAQLAETADPQPHRRTASVQVLDYYLHAAAVASGEIETLASRREFHLGVPIRPDLVKEHRLWRSDWLGRERTNLVSAVRYALEHGHYEHAWQIARAMWRFLYTHGYLDSLLETHKYGLEAAGRLGDANASATIANCLAAAYVRIGRYEEAARLVQDVIRHRHAQGDRFGEIIAHRNLAAVYMESCRYQEARLQYDRARTTASTTSDQYIDATLLLFIGDLHRTMGEHSTALRYSRRALVPARVADAVRIRAMALSNIGHSRSVLGQPEVALRLLFAALRAQRRLGYKFGEGETLNNIGIAYRMLGRTSDAAVYHGQALAVMREVGFRAGECDVYNQLGHTLRQAGDITASLAMHRRALDYAIKTRQKHGEARALDGIAACLVDTDPKSARQHWLQALQLYRELDVPERHQVERWLAELVPEEAR